jgi:hypothetical protein
MAIEINKPRNTIQAPSITVRGRHVAEGNGQADTELSTSSFTTAKVTTRVSNGTSNITHRGDDIFLKEVEVTIIPDDTFDSETYGVAVKVTPYNEVATSTLNVQGEKIVVGNKVARRSNTYYTLNGKDPSRTKANLYTGPFQIRRNASGTDNTILKARTYVEGQSSPVMQVDLRIIRNVTKNTEGTWITV